MIITFPCYGMSLNPTFVFVAAVHLCQNFLGIIYYRFFISVLSGTRLKPYHFFLLSNFIFFGFVSNLESGASVDAAS